MSTARRLLPTTCLFALLVIAPRAGLSAEPAADTPAFRAEDFVESLALNASPFDRYLTDGPWKGAGTKYPPEFFFDLGIRYYRAPFMNDLVSRQQPELVKEWWVKTGARPMLMVGDFHKLNFKGDFAPMFELLKRYDRRTIAELEGQNELNNKFPPQDLNMKYKGLTDEAAGSQYLKDLRDVLQADPFTRGLPVVCFTSIFSDYLLARPCDAFDFANMHSYQGSGVPSSSILMNMTAFNNIYPAGTTIKPFVPTECGYNVEEDRTNRQGYHGSRRAQAYNIPMLYAEYFRHGVRRTYLFALHNADGYGLLESDQETKRPSWYAVQSFVALLADARWDSAACEWKGGRTFEPRALRFRLDGAPETVHTLTLQKENGDWFLLVWNEIENFRNGRNVQNAPVPVRLTFAAGTPVECVEAFAQGELPDDVYANPEDVRKGAFARLAQTPPVRDGRLELQVPSKVLILRLRPTAGPSSESAPAAPLKVEGAATENSAEVTVTLPEAHRAESVLLFRNDMHVATLPPAATVRYEDRSAWIRPGLGYRFAAQTLAADGRLSKRIEGTIVTPDRRPDLVVGTFGPDLPDGAAIKPGDRVRFKGSVKNVGDGATPQPTPPNAGMWNSAITLTFSVDGQVVSWGGDDGQKPLAPGEERFSVATGGPQGHLWTATEGTHILKAHADDINRIRGERDEMNNIALRSLTVGAYPGRLSLESRAAPGHLDLSAEGREDWVQFAGWKDKGVTVRRKGAHRIGPLNQVGQGHIDLTGGSPIGLSWNDGEGVESGTNNHNGLWGNCVGNGFAFTVPADREERVLRVYVAGIEGARCEFSASLSDHSAPAVKDASWNGNRSNAWSPVPAGFSAVYELRYRAAKDGETLRVEWKLAEDPNRFRAQIRLQAATLTK